MTEKTHGLSTYTDDKSWNHPNHDLMDSAETCMPDLIVDDTYLDFSVLQSKLKFYLQLLSQHLYLKPKPAKAQAH